MTSNSSPQLFYNKSYCQSFYNKTITDVSAISDPSIQEAHNLAICRYLKNGDSPLPELQRLSNIIRANNALQNSWPSHPSWPLLQYHTALYSFKIGNYSQALDILEEFWNNSEKQDKFLMLFVSLLTVEISLRTNVSQTLLSNALNYFRSNFPGDSVQTFLQSKNIDSSFANPVVEATQFHKFKLEISELIRQNPKDGKAIEQYKKMRQEIDISEEAKANPNVPLSKGIPLSALAFHFSDFETSKAILDTIQDNTHFAVYNNKGIFELLSHRYSVALLHFSKALNARHNNELVYPFHLVAYNIGLSLLLKRKPCRAFKYLQSIIPLMKNSPFLWLRLAECIVLYYKQRIRKLRERSQVSPILLAKYSTDKQSFYILPRSNMQLFESDTKEVKDMNLVYAANCARNSITLCKPDQEAVRHKAELLCSYICLELGDGTTASEMSRRASEDSSSELFPAKIYAAQGLMLNNNYEEASKYLSRLVVESSFSKETDVNTLNFLTLAHVCLKMNDFKKAENQLTKAADSDSKRTELVLTNIWLDLQRKHPLQAIQEIKDYSETSDPSALDSQ